MRVQVGVQLRTTLKLVTRVLVNLDAHLVTDWDLMFPALLKLLLVYHARNIPFVELDHHGQGVDIQANLFEVFLQVAEGEQAAEGLAKQALRRHRNRGGMFSHLSPSGFARRGGRQAFDSKRWLEDVMAQPLTSAA